MSRSYKKSPVYTDGSAGNTKKSKRIANHVVRQTDFEILPQKGSGYKRYYCTYNIHDFICRWTWEEAFNMWSKEPEDSPTRKRYPTEKDFYRYWFRYHKRK